MSVATLVNWATNLLVALTFLTLVDSVGKPGAFWLYAALAVCARLFTWSLVPETKGHTLEEIEAHWQAGRHPREMKGKG
jgi:SP family galactose:H+ symporter-like MFS transporter